MYHESMNQWDEREDFPITAPPRPTHHRSSVPVERVRGPECTVRLLLPGVYEVACTCGLSAYRATSDAARECKRLHEGWHDNYEDLPEKPLDNSMR